MTKKLLYAHILLDRSGSMETTRDITIDAINEYVSTIAKDPDVDAAVSLSLFDAPGTYGNVLDLTLVHDGVPAATLPKLTRETYEPRGMTPLNDAIGKTVARMDGEWHRPGEVINLVIMTDGLENASTEFSKQAIKDLLDHRQKDKGWMVLFLGANQDAFAEGGARGVAHTHSMSYSPKNVGATMQAASRASLSHAHSGDASLGAFTDEERKRAS